MPDHHDAVPAVPFLELGAGGGGRLTGSKCRKCGATYAGARSVCGACGAREEMSDIRLSETGRLYAYTVVYRSFPGVKTPFVAAVVDLDGGGSLKGTLVDVVADPSAIAFDMPVKIVVQETGQYDANGAPFVSYVFKPLENAA